MATPSPVEMEVVVCLIDAVTHKGVTHRHVFGKPAIIDRTSGIQLLTDAAFPLGRSHGVAHQILHLFAILEMGVQRAVDIYILCTTLVAILHLGSHTHIVHKFGHRLSLLLGISLSIGIHIKHISPIVMTLREIYHLAAIRNTTLARFRPCMVPHNLGNGRCRTSRGTILHLIVRRTQVVVRLHLIPLCLHQRTDRYGDVGAQVGSRLHIPVARTHLLYVVAIAIQPCRHLYGHPVTDDKLSFIRECQDG